jgi:hypothetical protein
MTTTDEFDITQYLSCGDEDVEGSSGQGLLKTDDKIVGAHAQQAQEHAPGKQPTPPQQENTPSQDQEESKASAQQQQPQRDQQQTNNNDILPPPPTSTADILPANLEQWYIDMRLDSNQI